MTATHLKRLFANQDVFNSLDRNVAGLMVSEVDEKETKSAGSEGTSVLSEPATPASSVDGSCHLGLQAGVDDSMTSTAGVIQPVTDPLSLPQTPHDEDSDSTISAPRHSPGRSAEPLTNRIESSGIGSDVHDFVSRLPRRSLPAPRFVRLCIRADPLQYSRPRQAVPRISQRADFRAGRGGPGRATEIFRFRSARTTSLSQ